jgi:hypothetical protein
MGTFVSTPQQPVAATMQLPAKNVLVYTKTVEGYSDVIDVRRALPVDNRLMVLWEKQGELIIAADRMGISIPESHNDNGYR